MVLVRRPKHIPRESKFAGLSAARGSYIAVAATMSVTRGTTSAVEEHLFGAPYL